METPGELLCKKDGEGGGVSRKFWKETFIKRY